MDVLRVISIIAHQPASAATKWAVIFLSEPLVIALVVNDGHQRAVTLMK